MAQATRSAAAVPAAPVAAGALWLALLSAMALSTRDSRADWSGAASSMLHGAGVMALWVLPLIALTAFSALHYLASAVVLRSASGATLPWRESYLSQLAAASANRVLPAGLGGAVLNARYLTRRGVAKARALSAVAILPVLGAVADLAVFLVVMAGMVLTGAWSSARLTVPWHGFSSGAVAPLRLVAAHPIPAAVIALTLTVAGLALVRRHGQTAGSAVRRAAVELGQLARRPRDLAVTLLASGFTTLTLGFALIATLVLVTGPQVLTHPLPLLAAYLAGAAVGSAVPVPAGLGTDGALLAALVGVGIRPGQALTGVLIFRAISFWAPAGAGLLSLRHLRRAGAY